MSYVPTIDQSSCIAQGDCVELLPDVFLLDDFATVVDMVSSGAVDLAPYVSQTAPLVDAPAVFAGIADGAKYVRFVLQPDHVEKKSDHAQS